MSISEEISNVTAEIAVKFSETQDELIYETVSNFLGYKGFMYLKKQELVEAITLYRSGEVNKLRGENERLKAENRRLRTLLEDDMR